MVNAASGQSRDRTAPATAARITSGVAFHQGCRRKSRIGAPWPNSIEAIAADEIGARDVHRADGAAEDVGVEREVGVHVEDQLVLRRRETGAQRGAELLIEVVADEADLRISRNRAPHELRRIVGRGVVDDDDLVVARVLAQRLDRVRDRVLNVRLFVEHRNHERDRRRTCYQTETK